MAKWDIVCPGAKDGTLGMNEGREVFYNYSRDTPQWVQAIIEQAVYELKGETT